MPYMTLPCWRTALHYFQSIKIRFGCGYIDLKNIYIYSILLPGTRYSDTWYIHRIKFDRGLRRLVAKKKQTNTGNVGQCRLLFYSTFRFQVMARRKDNDFIAGSEDGFFVLRWRRRPTLKEVLRWAWMSNSSSDKSSNKDADMLLLLLGVTFLILLLLPLLWWWWSWLLLLLLLQRWTPPPPPPPRNPQ